MDALWNLGVIPVEDLKKKHQDREEQWLKNQEIQLQNLEERKEKIMANISWAQKHAAELRYQQYILESEENTKKNKEGKQYDNWARIKIVKKKAEEL